MKNIMEKCKNLFGIFSKINKKEKKVKEEVNKPKNYLARTLIIAILIVVVTFGFLGGTYLYRIKNLDLTEPYQSSLSDDSDYMEEFRKADSFASNLCVSSGNVGLNGITMTNGERSLLFDVDNNKVLYAQDIHKKSYPASITKIMTAILAVKYGNMDDTVTISSEDLDLEDGSQMCGFEVGDMVTMDELFHGLLVYSGNDAAMAIARHVGGTVDHFVEMMNEECKALGATNTHFVNPTGLQDKDHYTTAYDVYLMLNEAINYDDFVDTMQLISYNLTVTRGAESVQLHLDATDHYLTGEETAPTGITVLGGKTGTTTDAGACLAILSQNDYGAPYISIVLKAPTKATLYDDMNLLLEQINS